MVKGRSYRPNPSGVKKLEDMMGGDLIPRNGIGYDPMHEIIISFNGC